MKPVFVNDRPTNTIVHPAALRKMVSAWLAVLQSLANTRIAWDVPRLVRACTLNRR
jgi:hypothetical protein